VNPFQAALARITSGLNQYIATRPVALSNLYLANFLPPVSSTLAEIQTGSFRIVTEPAALTGVDSPYAKIGSLQLVNFNGRTFKITVESKLNESLQDAMHARANAQILRAAQQGALALTGGTNPQAVYENFISRVVEDGLLLAIDYGEEVFRAQALAYGKIQVKDSKTGNGVDMDFAVLDDYKVSRTGTAAYDKAASLFWTDVQAARNKLRQEPMGITDPTTFAAIVSNEANGIIVRSRTQLSSTVIRYELSQAAKTADGSTFNLGQMSMDVLKSVTITTYAGKGDAPDAPYFWPSGRLTFMRSSAREVELIDGQIVRGALGVTHIGPNTEAGQQSTRYVNIYVPQGAEYEVIGKASEDLMPYIEEARNLYLCKTELGA